MNNICKHYNSILKPVVTYSSVTGKPEQIKYISGGICRGTKEQEPCNCDGDSARCSFYEYIRTAASEYKN